MTAAEYIYEKCPGRAPTGIETRAVIEWCDEWARDTFGDAAVDEIDHDDERLADLRLLRAVHSRINGGLAYVLGDVRRIMSETRPMDEGTYALLARAGVSAERIAAMRATV